MGGGGGFELVNSVQINNYTTDRAPNFPLGVMIDRYVGIDKSVLSSLTMYPFIHTSLSCCIVAAKTFGGMWGERGEGEGRVGWKSDKNCVTTAPRCVAKKKEKRKKKKKGPRGPHQLSSGGQG